MKKYTQNQWRMRHMLNDVVEHFGKDPMSLRSVGLMGCTYKAPANRPFSIGCAIGMYVKPENRAHLDGEGAILDIIDSPRHKALLPAWMRKMDYRFLAEIQKLHDNEVFWNEKGLSDHGMQFVNRIIENYGLPPTIYG